jgi:hypothetical protein
LVKVPDAPEPLAAISNGPPVKNKGGRPHTHDWAGLAGYCIHFIVENDYPDTQATLVAIAMDWFRNRAGRTPDNRDVERWVAELYRMRPKTGKT